MPTNTPRKWPNLDDYGIYRDDVPYVYRASVVGTFQIMFVVSWIWVLAGYHPAIPGIVELALGVGCGFVVGMFYSRAGIAQARAASAASRENPSLVWFPFMPEAGIREYFTAVGVAFAVCLGLVAADYALYLSMQGLAMPWAHYNNVTDFPYASVVAAAVTYTYVDALVYGARILGWYRALPERKTMPRSEQE